MGEVAAVVEEDLVVDLEPAAQAGGPQPDQAVEACA